MLNLALAHSKCLILIHLTFIIADPQFTRPAPKVGKTTTSRSIKIVKENTLWNEENSIGHFGKGPWTFKGVPGVEFGKMGLREFNWSALQREEESGACRM